MNIGMLFENCITFQVYELVGHLMSEKKPGDDQEKTSAMNKSLFDLLKGSRAALIDHLFSAGNGG